MALVWCTFDEEMRQRARAEYLDAGAPHRNGDGYAIPGEFVIMSGSKRHQ